MPLEGVTQLSGAARAQASAAAKTVARPVPGQDIATAGKVAPAPPAPPVSRTDVREAVRYLNEYVQSLRRDLTFTVDEDLDRMIVRVVDAETGELVRQIPAEEMVAVARALRQNAPETGILMQDRA
jgi:flagellar protein FlaG